MISDAVTQNGSRFRRKSFIIVGSEVFKRGGLERAIAPGGIFIGVALDFYTTHLLLIKMKNIINWLISILLLF